MFNAEQKAHEADNWANLRDITFYMQEVRILQNANRDNIRKAAANASRVRRMEECEEKAVTAKAEVREAAHELAKASAHAS